MSDTDDFSPRKIHVFGGEITAPFLALALRELGCEVDCMDTPDDPDSIEVAIGVNHKFPEDHYARKREIPRVIWFTDLHADIYNPPENYDLGKLDDGLEFLFCFSPQQAKWFEKAGARRVAYLPPAADPSFFNPSFENLKLGSFLTFLGEARISQQNDMARVKDELTANCGDDPDLAGLFDELDSFITERTANFAPRNPNGLSADLSSRLSPGSRRLARRFPSTRWARAIENQLNATQRVELCRRLEAFDLKIWGNVGDWGKAGVWRSHAGRRADFFREWPSIIAHSSACVNLFRPSIWHGVPQKAFEIAAGGSVLLSNWHPNLELTFAPGKECLTFKTLDECLDLVNWLKNEPNDFSVITKAARNRVLSEHTYLHRAQAILKTLTATGVMG